MAVASTGNENLAYNNNECKSERDALIKKVQGSIPDLIELLNNQA